MKNLHDPQHFVPRKDFFPWRDGSYFMREQINALETIVIPAEFKWWAKMGYGARGLIYLVIGGLGVMAATNHGGETTDTKGAILTIVEQPFGYALLVLLVVGMCGYSVWRLIQAVRDTDHHGRSPKGLVIRMALFGSSVTHALLAVWAIALLDGQDDESPTGALGLLNSSAGQTVFFVAGLVCIAAGLAHIYKGWKAGFEKYMRLPPATQIWARPMCRFGLMARGVVWCMVGWFFVDSSLKAQANEIRGIDEALTLLQQSTYGQWLLLIVSSGLFSFGIYSCLEALYRRINVSAASGR